MEILNPLTKGKADVLYAALNYTRVDGFDNTTDYIVLGYASEYRAFQLDYAVVLPVSGRSRVGSFNVMNDGAAVDFTDEYSFSDSDIEGLSFSVNITLDRVTLVFTKTMVGENPTFFYKRASVPV
jgi:hypothetical protein